MIPTLFIAHGAPLLAIEDNDYTQFLNQLGQKMTRPKAVVLFSAHWETGIQKVSEVKDYETIYDFGGFPNELYQIRYPAKGDHKTVQEIKNFFTENGIPFESETKRGLDHGAWIVLRLLYPNADIPVIAMSVNPCLTPEQQYKIGQSLRTLRANNILVIGSGGTVHNLRAVQFQENQINDWALQFDQWLEKHLMKWDLDSLYQYDTLAPNASLAVPPHGNEHFIPIFYAMGAADEVRKATLLHRSYRYGNLSHSVWQFG
ncbi:DODA-type extradiol aromatic ring-opening family dioxygenase [Sulfoacidibacillus ferrooxidans]|uniref:4,5-DOPA dioxygenase extradiol n=1 Tax=Sulfoacidibacillus ferrooxidans TaxID=2005001 RepID=A0A9X1VA36_9BACL|nr:class III extradiol ring-cleavage dioxygenase [Sulfoacidibacillus ferrooxidans]MCI0184456.1 4,5-DOPA dioxygenase extradiol [Sulfoacidibacillus ferrooxidans]